MKRIVSGVLLAMFISGMLYSTFHITLVGATATTYIRGDGSIEPSTAPIQRNGDVYTLTGNITSDTDGIVIERSYLTIDGAGYTVKGNGKGNGFLLASIVNVTIKNTVVEGFGFGVYLQSTSQNVISGNYITSNQYDGIVIIFSDNNVISNNTVTNNGDSGCFLNPGSMNRISNNTIRNNSYGILLWRGTNNEILTNILESNDGGVFLGYSSATHNEIQDNKICQGYYGIYLYDSLDNNIWHNTFADNTYNAYINDSNVNIWDGGYPSGGNYWSDYTDVDANSDGIWDHPYVIDANNTDRYPLVIPLGVKIPTPVILNAPSEIESSSVMLHWSRNTDPDFLCYGIIVSRYPRKPVSGYGSSPHVLIYDQQVVSHQVTSLDSSTEYYFVIRTFNKQGACYDSNSVSITTISSVISGIIPWQVATALWMLGAMLAVGGMGFAMRSGKLSRMVRRMLVIGIIFVLSFAVYYPIAQFPANALDPRLPYFYLEFATVLFVTFLFSAFERGLGWPFIFGNSLTWGLVLGYNFFFGYPFWLLAAYLVGEGLFFGILYALVGAAGQRVTGWVQNRKIAAQLKTQEEEQKRRAEEEQERIETERKQFETLTTETRNIIEKSKTSIKDPEILSALLILEAKISNISQDFEAGAMSFSDAKSSILEIKGDAETLSIPKETLYDVLGVSVEAGQEEIRKAYRNKIIEYHPDKVGSWANMDKIPEWVKEESNEMTKKINEAYETLSDPSRRKEYDGKIGV